MALSLPIRIKRGNSSNLPTLAEGEPGYTTDEKKIYIGTGSGNIELAKTVDVNVALSNKADISALSYKADRSELAAKQSKIKGGAVTLIGNAWTAVGDLFQQSIPVQNLPADPGGMSTTTCTTIGWPFDSMAKAGEYGVGLYDQPAGQLVFRATSEPDVDLVCAWSFEEVTGL